MFLASIAQWSDRLFPPVPLDIQNGPALQAAEKTLVHWWEPRTASSQRAPRPQRAPRRSEHLAAASTSPQRAPRRSEHLAAASTSPQRAKFGALQAAERLWSWVPASDISRGAGFQTRLKRSGNKIRGFSPGGRLLIKQLPTFSAPFLALEGAPHKTETIPAASFPPRGVPFQSRRWGRAVRKWTSEDKIEQITSRLRRYPCGKDQQSQ